MAEDFFDSLDRSKYGRFVVGRDVFILVDVSTRARVLRNNGVNVTDDDNHSWRDMNKALRAEGVGLHAVTAEIMLWWAESDDPRLVDASRIILRGGGDQIPIYVERLRKVEQYPAMHDYFAVGIWDVDVIAPFVADGIDVEMASRILAVAV